MDCSDVASSLTLKTFLLSTRAWRRSDSSGLRAKAKTVWPWQKFAWQIQDQDHGRYRWQRMLMTWYEYLTFCEKLWSIYNKWLSAELLKWTQQTSKRISCIIFPFALIINGQHSYCTSHKNGVYQEDRSLVIIRKRWKALEYDHFKVLLRLRMYTDLSKLIFYCWWVILYIMYVVSQLHIITLTWKLCIYMMIRTDEL